MSVAKLALLEIRARVILRNGQEVDAIAVNPGEWFGDCYLFQVAIANSLNPFLVVEADHEQDAIDTLADSEWSHLIDVPEEDLVDVPEDERHYAGNDGHAISLDNVHLESTSRVSYYVRIPDTTDSSVIEKLATVVDTINKELREDSELFDC